MLIYGLQKFVYCGRVCIEQNIICNSYSLTLKARNAIFGEHFSSLKPRFCDDLSGVSHKTGRQCSLALNIDYELGMKKYIRLSFAFSTSVHTIITTATNIIP